MQNSAPSLTRPRCSQACWALTVPSWMRIAFALMPAVTRRKKFWARRSGWRDGGEARAEVQEKIRAACLQGAQGTPYRAELPYHWADGTERLVEFELHPIRDEKGRVIFLHPTGVDITDVKRTQENYRTLADNISQFAWMANSSGWMYWFNQRWFDYTGTTLDAVQGAGWQSSVAPGTCRPCC